MAQEYIVITECRNKVASMQDNERYEWLKQQMDAAINYFYGVGLQQIRSEDFIERLASMPEDYIRDWLNGNGDLSWRNEDKRRLAAIKCGGKRVLDEHPNAFDICQISCRSEEAYVKNGYIVGERKGDYLIVYRE